jgi:hypothetical protein
MASNATPGDTSTNANQQAGLTGLSALGPGDIPISEHYINDNNWPKDFKLNLQKNNWDKWSF